MDDYFASTTVISNVQDTTGWNIFALWDWVGTDLIRPFLGIVFYEIEQFKWIIIVLFIVGGVLHFVNKGFKFFNT